MALLDTKHVWFNDGTDEDVFALVVKKHSPDMLDLRTFSGGSSELHTSVPRRDKADYGEEGGGRTWHV